LPELFLLGSMDLTMKFTQHPLSSAFPAMQEEEYESLFNSIGEIGVQNPITLFEGMVIDGWHRYRAANEAGLDCPTVVLGDVDPRDFVLAQNKARRNLTASQRAAAVASVYQWAASKGVNQHTKRGGEPGSPPPKTNAELAAIAGTTTRTIQQAKVAIKAGLADAVKDGAMTVKEAAQIAAGKPVKAPYVEPENREYFGPSEQELQEHARAAKDDINTVIALIESDDPMAALLIENERQRMEIATLKSQRDGYMNQTNELIRRVKSLRKQIDKLKEGQS
jgi:hypothetical protein